MAIQINDRVFNLAAVQEVLMTPKDRNTFVQHAAGRGVAKEFGIYFRQGHDWSFICEGSEEFCQRVHDAVLEELGGVTKVVKFRE